MLDRIFLDFEGNSFVLSGCKCSSENINITGDDMSREIKKGRGSQLNKSTIYVYYNFSVFSQS